MALRHMPELAICSAGVIATSKRRAGSGRNLGSPLRPFVKLMLPWPDKSQNAQIGTASLRHKKCVDTFRLHMARRVLTPPHRFFAASTLRFDAIMNIE